MEFKEVPLVTSIEEAIPHIKRWGEEECSPMVTMRMANALDVLNAIELRKLHIKGYSIAKLASISPLLIDIYFQAYDIQPCR
jgi:hypothetical protein